MDCSKAAADCTCSNTLGVGSCGNPGLFNSTAASDYCYGICSLVVGHDVNDCDDSIFDLDNPVNPVPELSTLILCSLGLIGIVGYVGIARRRKD